MSSLAFSMRRLTGQTFLCWIHSGTIQHHAHPACDATIQEAAWFDLRDPAGWPPLIVSDSITCPWLDTVRAALGYGTTGPA